MGGCWRIGIKVSVMKASIGMCGQTRRAVVCCTPVSDVGGGAINSEAATVKPVAAR